MREELVGGLDWDVLLRFLFFDLMFEKRLKMMHENSIKSWFWKSFDLLQGMSRPFSESCNNFHEIFLKTFLTQIQIISFSKRGLLRVNSTNKTENSSFSISNRFFRHFIFNVILRAFSSTFLVIFPLILMKYSWRKNRKMIARRKWENFCDIFLDSVKIDIQKQKKKIKQISVRYAEFKWGFEPPTFCIQKCFQSNQTIKSFFHSFKTNQSIHRIINNNFKYKHKKS